MDHLEKNCNISSQSKTLSLSYSDFTDCRDKPYGLHIKPFSTTAVLTARAERPFFRDHVKKQSRAHAKKVECSSTLKRVCEKASAQKMCRLDNYRES